LKQLALEALHQSLQQNSWMESPLLQDYRGLELLPDKGLAHWHVRILGSELLARVPKQSQMGWAPDINLVYQSACFRAAQSSGRVPAFFGTCPISTNLPYGALLVQEIIGSAAQLPKDLQAIATTLASVHSIDLRSIHKSDVERLKKDTSLGGILTEIIEHRASTHPTLFGPQFYKILDSGIHELGILCQSSPTLQARLIAYDVHPGNFMIQPNGVAILVDLEKVRISAAGFDLAHATQYTSTTWDIESRADLDIQAIKNFYDTWYAKVQPTAVETSSFLITRKAMWLWAISWCGSWLSTNHPSFQTSDPNPIKENNDARLFAHVKERCEHYISPVGLDRVLTEMEQLKAHWQ
jgi:Phosphotransferase enzyme family